MRPSWGLGLLLALFAGFLVLQGAATGLRPRQPPGPSAPAPRTDLAGRVLGPGGPIGGARGPAAGAGSLWGDPPRRHGPMLADASPCPETRCGNPPRPAA